MTTALWWFSIIAQAGVAARILHLQLEKRYRGSFLFSICGTVGSAGLMMAGGFSTTSYARAWIVYQTVTVALLTLATVENYVYLSTWHVKPHRVGIPLLVFGANAGLGVAMWITPQAASLMALVRLKQVTLAGLWLALVIALWFFRTVQPGRVNQNVLRSSWAILAYLTASMIFARSRWVTAGTGVVCVFWALAYTSSGELIRMEEPEEGEKAAAEAAYRKAKGRAAETLWQLRRLK